MDTDALEKVSGFTSLNVDFGGGIHTEADIRLALESGADRIHASAVVEFKQEIFASWLITFTPAKIVLSLDIINNQVLYRQNGRIVETPLNEVVEFCDDFGVTSLKCAMHDLTIDKAIEKYSTLVKQYPAINFTAATGVQSLDDIKKLEDAGLKGVVFAKALLENQISLDALSVFISKQS